MRVAAALGLAVVGFSARGATARVRDMAVVAGARDNQLMGIGLVMGLAGDGDKDPIYTKQAFANMLQRHGLNVPASAMSSKNVALVMVTADIPAFAKPGTRLDVTVSSLGDAKSLQGGTLMLTPLLGADDGMYAVAQGPVTLGGLSAGAGGGGGSSVVKNHPTVATITDGALVERDISASMVQDNSVELLLRDQSFTSAARLAEAVNLVFTNSATAVDSMSVRVRIPEGLETQPVEFIARLEAVEITPDTPARIIINERTGTIVATSTIRISNCAVSQGNLTITVSRSQDVSQPNPLSGGTTTTTPRTDTKVTESKAAMVALPELPTVEKIASSLNALGVTPREMMSIFQAMKQAGALQAELITR